MTNNSSFSEHWPQRKMTQINDNIYELNATVEVELNEVKKANLRQCWMEAPKPSVYLLRMRWCTSYLYGNYRANRFWQHCWIWLVGLGWHLDAWFALNISRRSLPTSVAGHCLLQSIYYVCNDVLCICMEIIELTDFGNDVCNDLKL